MERGFSTRLGFILVSAGCAIGLGNVWRFPYITGEYGGAAFVLIYLLFLAILGLPIMVAELAVGRASVRSVAMSFDELEPKGTKWHIYKYFGIAGNILLLMFYTCVTGWMLYYLYKCASGDLVGMSAEELGGVFGGLLADPVTMTGYMVLSVLITGGICFLGVQRGVERITKYMMLLLLVLMVVLAVNSCLLPGSEEGLKYYLMPDFGRLVEHGIMKVIFDAMGQAFFTLSIGIGAIAVFGSYISKQKRLTGEAIYIIILDTFVAIMAGLIIFPACFSYGVSPSSGPNLLFVAMTNVFNHMDFGRLWGALFFLFMAFAAFSTLVAVFENIICCFIELLHIDRKKIIRVAVPGLMLLSMPCILGFNVLSGIEPLGAGTGIMDLEDFLVSNNILPLGSLVYLAFCTWRFGWGWDNFVAETDTGSGMKFPRAMRFYLTYILPIVVLVIFAGGYYSMFFAK